MILKIGDFEIYGYDTSDKDQRHLRYVLENDVNFRKYVTKQLEKRLRAIEINDRESLQFNSSYLVKYKEEFVGYIRLGNVKWDGTLDIEWAVSPEFRNQKLGRRIVSSLSNYIFENFEEVKKLRGVIDKSNYASKKMASSIGFIEEKVDSEYDYDYIYVTKTR